MKQEWCNATKTVALSGCHTGCYRLMRWDLTPTQCCSRHQEAFGRHQSSPGKRPFRRRRCCCHSSPSISPCSGPGGASSLKMLFPVSSWNFWSWIFFAVLTTGSSPKTMLLRPPAGCICTDHQSKFSLFRLQARYVPKKISRNCCSVDSGPLKVP